MACGEYGPGRMSEPATILAAIEQALEGETAIPLPPALRRPRTAGPLAGKRIIITSGPTHEPIDPVRYIANRSSGKQGHALAVAAAAAGAEVILVSGPVALPDPAGIETRHVETAAEMFAAVEAALPADMFIAAAAVADWRVAEAATDKIKKGTGAAPVLPLVQNPDILASVARRGSARPRLVVGFAAETVDVLAHAQAKLACKGCDVIIANDVSLEADVMGSDENQVTIITPTKIEALPRLRKDEVAVRLVARFAELLQAMPQVMSQVIPKDGSGA